MKRCLVSLVLALSLVCMRVAMAQAPAPAEGQGAVGGRVQTHDKRPVAGAVVRLDDGQSAVTDHDGSFHIAGVPAGRHTLSVEAKGYKSASGAVTVAPGQTRSVLVETRLLGQPAAQKPRTGTLYVKGYAKTGYKGGRAYVTKIEVWEQGDRNHYWSDSWWTDSGYAYRSVSCPGAVIGKTYKIAIMWKSSKGGGTRYGTWIKTFWTSSQTERFYQP